MTLQGRQDAALEPVRAALLDQAARDAVETVARARHAAAAMIAEAHADAEMALATGREDGVAQATPVATAELAQSRQAARSIVLGADMAVRAEVVRRIKDAVMSLRDESGYPLLRSRLSEVATRLAGPGAVVTEHPAGGVIARTDAVTVDCSLARLADLAIAALEARIAHLCGLGDT